MAGSRGTKTIDYEGVNPGLRVRFVCRQCNHGWLSELEESVRPIIGAMIQDLPIPIDASHQRAAARWAVKMAMVLEGIRDLSRDAVFYSQDERQAFRTTQTIPNDTIVWLARYGGPMHTYMSSLDGVYESFRDRQPADALASTFTVGRLAFQVLTLRLTRQHKAAVALKVAQSPGTWADLMFQVWPPQTMFLPWPPARSFADTGSESSIQAWERRWATRPPLP